MMAVSHAQVGELYCCDPDRLGPGMSGSNSDPSAIGGLKFVSACEVCGQTTRNRLKSDLLSRASNHPHIQALEELTYSCIRAIRYVRYAGISDLALRAAEGIIYPQKNSSHTSESNSDDSFRSVVVVGDVSSSLRYLAKSVVVIIPATPWQASSTRRCLTLFFIIR